MKYTSRLLIYAAGQEAAVDCYDLAINKTRRIRSEEDCGAGEFVDRAAALMGPVTGGYLREGRRYATIAIGCTGGKHRSVAVTQALAVRLATERVETFVVHRDLGRE